MNADNFTIKETMLNAGDGNELYVHDWGNLDATNPIIFLHGGPGSGCNEKHKSLFNPLLQRVIFFDQRGCGKSQPYGSIVDNGIEDSIEDINKIAAAHEIGKYILTGGSWGSCLALSYAIQYPDKVSRMVLRGIFTGRQSEIDFIDKGVFRNMYPDVWDTFVASVPKSNRHDPGGYHLPRVLGDNPDQAKESAYAYSTLEGSLASFDDRFTPEAFDEFDPAPTKIECHYLANKCFLPEGYIMDNAHLLSMPIALVQGRYDMVCPPFTAYELAQKLPNAKLYWTVAGHSGNDRPNWDLTRALLAESPS